MAATRTNDSEIETPDHFADEEPQTALEWKRFIEKEVGSTLSVYRTKPRLLLSQVRSEKQIADDYAGRELLEMVQNAADAAAETGGGGRVLIEISRDGIIVANTGQPFRMGGVESLMTAHTSDKPTRKRKLIGAKGLGFRALLNWSHEPIISSGALEMGFSAEHAAAMIDELVKGAAGVRKIVDQEDERPVPALAFPAIGEELERVGNAQASKLLGRTRGARAEGFDTVVAAPFDDSVALDRATVQAAEFEPTFLLFVSALASITLRIEGRPEVIWQRRKLAGHLELLAVTADGVRSEQRWLCYRRSGELSLKAARKTTSFEAAVALRIDEPNAPGYLHSYFPTSILLPFPALFHATLELDSNRKSLKSGSELNNGVLHALAELFTESLETVALDQKAGVLGFLEMRSDFPEPLVEFERAAYASAQTRRIVPVARGRRVTPAEARIGPSGYQNYLPTKLFKDLARVDSDAERQVLERIGVEQLAPAVIVKELKKAKLTIDERARAIIGVASTLDRKFHDRGLFIDQSGRPMRPSNTPFPPPASEDRLPTLPDWARARFIDRTLWTKVIAGLDGQTFRDRVKRLDNFGISEFSNQSIILSLRSQANQALNNKRRDPDLVQRQLLSAIFALFLHRPDNRTPPASFKVLSADGTWRDAREVHLSARYGEIGRINSALYRSAPDCLLADSTDNGIDPEAGDTSAFFEWLGVNRWPREVTLPVAERFQEVVLAALPPEVEFTDGHVVQKVPRQNLGWGYNLDSNASTIARLDSILDTAESDAILAWLARDPRFDHAAPYRFDTTVRGRHDGRSAMRRYEGKAPDLVLHQIRSTPWLACSDDAHHAPADCMAQPGRLTGLFTVPRAAVVGSDVAYGLSQALWRRGLANARVPHELADLSEAGVYGLLTSLPERPIADDVVKRLYQQILELGVFDIDNAPAERAVFLDRGKVQVYKGHTIEWVSPGEALYADQSSFPQAVREHLRLIGLPPRRNATNVRNRFGVAPLSRQDFHLEITQLTEDTSLAAGMLRSDLQSARPYIRALRLLDSNVTARLKRFDRLALKIVRAAEIRIAIGEQQISGPLEPWTHVLQDDDLIVAIDASKDIGSASLLAHEAIADGIAEVFDLQSGADFAKLLAARDGGVRRTLLARMLPNFSQEELSQSLVDVSEPDERYEPSKINPETLARGPKGSSEPAVDRDSDSSTTVVDTGTSKRNPPPPPPPKPVVPGAVTSTPLVNPTRPVFGSGTSSDGPRVGVRITAPTGAIGATPHADPFRAADAEAWTRLFEVEQGRFPLDVAFLQGRDAFGCDCLSFAKLADLEAFKADPQRTELVARFIETKSGAIQFSDNETRAAETRTDRLFVYRLQFFAGNRDFAELTIVCDPLRYREALVAQYEFNIDLVGERARFQIFASQSDLADE
jgi:hypothetical protein